MNYTDAAVALAEQGWPLLPLSRRSKTPRIAKHPDCRATACRGDCGREGHGLKDATTDLDTIRRWWRHYPSALIGARVPDTLLVLDIDPRHGGDARLAALEAIHGALPPTLTVWSGREDGGRHLYYLRPAGKPTERGLRAELRRVGALGPDEDEAGIDLKAAGGYCVMPPSLHPATGKPYRWDIHAVAALPEWMRALLVPPAPPPLPPRPPRGAVDPFALRKGERVADGYCERTRWADLLDGWELVEGDGEKDGSKWRHPRATSRCSATVSNGSLYVYSSNTPFEVTTKDAPCGYSKFRAFAVLHHRGDMRAAAAELRGDKR